MWTGVCYAMPYVLNRRRCIHSWTYRHFEWIYLNGFCLCVRVCLTLFTLSLSEWMECCERKLYLPCRWCSLNTVKQSPDTFASISQYVCIVQCNMQVEIASINNRTRFFLRLFNKVRRDSFVVLLVFSVAYILWMCCYKQCIQLRNYFEQVSQNAFELIP